MKKGIYFVFNSLRVNSILNPLTGLASVPIYTTNKFTCSLLYESDDIHSQRIRVHALFPTNLVKSHYIQQLWTASLAKCCRDNVTNVCPWSNKLDIDLSYVSADQLITGTIFSILDVETHEAQTSKQQQLNLYGKALVVFCLK